uniref:antitoxin Xre/MbcA/ParS toxin-binding domain-containing protein n=1 Tax=Marinobacterium profundum TaxID=1714300 RepID=UPI000832B5A0|nr:antitoxin Xre/MbcA/ParS toxin-binding domain-containing protein [Marinobacterium profundum]
MVQNNARQRLLDAATGYFGSREGAEEWINSPHMGLEGMTPQEMLNSSGSTVEQIMELVHQLEQGDTP